MDKLSIKQQRFVDAYISSNENQARTAQVLGLAGHQSCQQYMKSTKVMLAIEMARDRALLFVRGKMNDPVITKCEVARMFVEIAKAGMERGFDKEGNSIMINPGSANTALGHVSQLYAYNAPTETIETKVTRTELEISTSIQSLQAELGELLEHDGQKGHEKKGD